MAQLNKKSVDAVVKSVRKLNDEIIKLNKSHDELRADNVKAAEANKKLKTTIDNLKTSQKNLSTTEKELIKLNKQLKTAEAQLTPEFRKAKLALTQKTEAVKRANKAARDQVNAEAGVKRSGSGLIRVFKAQVKAIAAVALGYIGLTTAIRVIKDITRRIIAFDKAMQNMAGIAGKSRKELRDVERTIKAVAGASIKTSNEVAELATVLFTLGKTRSEVILMLKPINDLSIALNATSEDAADFLGQTLNAFGEGAGSAQRFADIIANIRASTALDFERIKESFGFIAPTAKALNITIGRTGALMGVLQDNGIKAARAGRLLNTSFARLINRGLTLDEALQKINESTNKVKTASELFGARSFTLALILANNIEKVNRLANEFDNLSEGSLKKLTDEQLKAVANQLKILDSTWERFILRIDSGNGVISATIRQFVSLGIAVLNAGKSFSDIAIEVSVNATADALSGLNQELRVVSESLQRGGVDALDANKRAVDLLILQYLKLQAEAGGTNDQINAQVEKLKELQAEFENTAPAIDANAIATQKLTDKLLAQNEALNKKLLIEEDIARLRAEARDITSEEEQEEDLEAELEEDFEIEIDATKNFLNEKARLEAEDFLRKEELAMAEIELENLKIHAKQRGLRILASIFSRQSILGKALFIAEKANAIARILINGAEERSAIRSGPLAKGVPFTLPLIAALTTAASIRTGINVALVAAQAIRGFKKGTDGKFNTPDTFRVGEGNKTELIVDKKGGITQVNKETIVSGMKGKMVISNPELKAMANNKDSSTTNNNIDTDKIINGFGKHLRKNKTTFLMDENRNVYGFETGGYKRNWL